MKTRYDLVTYEGCFAVYENYELKGFFENSGFNYTEMAALFDLDLYYWEAYNFINNGGDLYHLPKNFYQAKNLLDTK